MENIAFAETAKGRVIVKEILSYERVAGDPETRIARFTATNGQTYLETLEQIFIAPMVALAVAHA